MSARATCSTALLVGVLLAGRDAHAQDVWTEPHPGVRHLFRTNGDPNRIHVVEIDLTSPGVRLRATRSADRGRVVSDFAGLYGCHVATNADFFTAGFVPTGLAVGAGEPWPDVDDGDQQSFIAFSTDNAVYVSPPWDIVAGPDAWMTELVSGRERVTENGVAAEYVSGNPDVAPRTAVGIDADGTTLYVVVVDGRTDISVGMTLYQLGALMAEVGATWAINLDGGGSSTMFVAAEGGVVNDPSDGAERVVANHLGVAILGYAGSVIDQSHPTPTEGILEIEMGQTIEGIVELRNMGTATWMPGVTKLAPVPRDQPSPLGGPPAWIEVARVSTVDAPTPPGETGTFALPLVGGQPGHVVQSFALVEEGVTWFADAPLGGGPAEDVIAVEVEVVESCGATSCDEGESGAQSEGAAGESSDGTAGGLETTASSTDGTDALPPGHGDDSATGCGCMAATKRPVPLFAWVVMMLGGLSVLARRRRDRVTA